jgi:hypothetical protein
MRNAMILALALALPATASAARAPYTRVAAPFQESPRFVVTYEGTGRWHTVYRATPPNPGGKPDHNRADDAGTQAWRLRFRSAVTVPACGPPADGGADPCAQLAGTSGAVGPTRATGRVRHVHVDGLYRQLDRTVKCRVSRRTGTRTRVDATVGLAYDAAAGAIGVTAYNPLTTVLTLLPTACPRQGDSIDRILDNYFTPGFSFDPAYGADRWFTSRAVKIPSAIFHDSATIAIAVADTRAGTPPRRCAVKNRTREHCRTGGSWTGRLVFTRRS